MILTLLQGRVPGQVIIQYTDRCNAKCPQCGMRASEPFPRSKLSVEKGKKILRSAAKKGVKAVSFTGGEPFLYLQEITELLQYAGEVGIEYIRSGTNGFMFKDWEQEDYEKKIEDFVQTLTKTKIRNFWISIDSMVPEVHEEMRGLPGVMEGIKRALPIFHRSGLYPSANLGINRNMGGFSSLPSKLAPENPEEFAAKCREAFRKYYQYLLDLGFTMVNACYPMSIDPTEEGSLKAVYGATSVDGVVQFTRQEKALLFGALLEVIPEFRGKIRIFTPRTALYALVKQYQGEKDYGFPCRGGIDFFFITAKDANTYPCGYRGEDNYGKFWDLDWKKMKKKAFCKECDWECFRDPSELVGYLLEFLQRPLSFMGKVWKDRDYLKLWLEDLSYYRACQFFNARVAPDYSKMKKYLT